MAEDTTLDFITEIVASAPDLPPFDPDGTDAAAPKAKRRK